VDAILEVLEGMHADEARDPNEGLRERKKRRVRQKISNVATAMFLVHGFDNVTVAQIAAAAEVSEQTVFNYFTTKESMFFDRSEPMINAVADAVRERGSTSLVEAVVQVDGRRDSPGRWEALDEAGQLHLSGAFVTSPPDRQRLSRRGSLICRASSTRYPSHLRNGSARTRSTPRCSSPPRHRRPRPKSECSRPFTTSSTRLHSPR
jgi:AcrR family transcriptional regulator